MKKNPKNTSRNREYVIVTYVILALLISLCGYFVYYLQFRSETFINSSYNKRIGNLEAYVVKGDIVSSDGVLLATSVIDGNGNVIRSYPQGKSYAHAIGFSENGAMGLEKDANFTLLRSHSFIIQRLVNEINGKKNIGDTAVSSIDSRLQKLAYDGLGSYRGAVIAMDPKTGEVLCEVSKPDFDPNTIAANWESISSDSETSALLNRNTQGLYPPGSVFKILTTMEYLREGGSPDDVFTCNGEYTLGDSTIHCYHGKVHGQQSLKKAFANSCNCVFAQIAGGLNPNAFTALCETLLFNEPLPGNLYPSRESSFNVNGSTTQAMMMQTAIGQGLTLVSPVHMLMLVSAIENDGVLIKPHLIKEIVNDSGEHVRNIKPETFGSIMSESETSTMRDFMREVVLDGTASKMSGASYDAYGKTGTAEFATGSDKAHSWFCGFAEMEGKSIAIAVIMEGAGAGSEYATPLAKKIFDAYFTNP